jgi:hypothetical protein
MKKVISSIALFGCTLISNPSNSQVSAYTFSQSIKPYGTINTGTLIGTNYQDDDINTATLPFSFVFNGASYTSVDVSSNGFISFANPFNALTNPISDASSQSIISAFGSDILMGTFTMANLTAGSNTLTNVMNTNNLSIGDSLFDYNGDFASGTVSITAIIGNNVVLNTNVLNTNQNYLVIFYTGSLRQTNLGLAPNRISEFEFRNFARNSSLNEGVSFKIRLYETSNKIEFLYGTMNVDNINQPLEVGLKGNSITDFNIRKVTTTNTWNSSINGTLVTDACELNPSLSPSLGRSFEWTPSCSLPQLNATQSNSVICAGTSATLNASGASTYSWVSQSSLAQIVITPTASTTYTLFGFSGSCTSSLTLTQSVLPTPTVGINTTATLICKGKTATLTASGATSYSWSNGSNLSSTTISPTITTTYTASASNGICSASKTISIKVDNCTNISVNLGSENNVISYPNPFTTELNFKNTGSTKMNVKLISILGKVVTEFELIENEELIFNTSHLATGIYILESVNKELKHTKKIIKQ